MRASYPVSGRTLIGPARKTIAVLATIDHVQAARAMLSNKPASVALDDLLARSNDPTVRRVVRAG